MTIEERYSQQFGKWHAVLEQRAARVFYKVLKQSVTPVIETLDINNLKRGLWRQAYYDVYTQIGKYIRLRESKWLRRNQKALGVGFGIDEAFNMRMAAYAILTGNELEGFLDETTLEKVQKALQEASLNGYTQRQTARLIYDYTLGVVGRDRAMLIGRTETTGAINYAKLETGRDYLKEIGASDNGYKVWINRDDGKVRPTHVEAGDTGVPFESDFTVGGENGGFPGDRRFSAKERVRCRCTFLTMSEAVYRRRFAK